MSGEVLVVGQARVSRAGSAQQLQAGASPAAAMQVNCAVIPSSQSQAQRDPCARRAQGRGKMITTAAAPRVAPCSEERARARAADTRWRAVQMGNLVL